MKAPKPAFLIAFAAVMAALPPCQASQQPQGSSVAVSSAPLDQATFSLDGLFPDQAPLPPEANAHYLNLSAEAMQGVLNDHRSRVDNRFHIPRTLRSYVTFWLKIYAKFSSYQIVVFDKDDPSKIYWVQDDRDLFQRGLTAVGIEINSKSRLRKTLAELRAALAQLQANPRRRFKPDSMGARVTSLWGRKSRAQWKTIADNLKTQRGQRDFVMRGIRASMPFMAPMEEIFQSYGLPGELTRITLLESSFQIHAHSKADAVGVWQFLEKSGREYLTIDKKNGIDERISPIKAAHAAAKMIKRNVRLLGEHAFAIIAYNHGARNLLRIKRKYGRIDLVKLLDPANKASPLGYASRNYYAEFLAILYADKYADEIYALPRAGHRYEVRIVKLDAPATFFEIASRHNSALDDLKRFNPDVFDLRKRLRKGVGVVIPQRVESVSRSSVDGDIHGVRGPQDGLDEPGTVLHVEDLKVREFSGRPSDDEIPTARRPAS